MLLHESNLYHLVVFVASFLLLDYIGRNTRVKRMRSISTLIQLGVVLLCVDLLVGFALIDKLYGSSLSAGWISKALFAYPALTLLAIGRVFVHHKRAAKPPS